MTHPKIQRTGLVRVLHAAGYSARGLRAAWRHEAAFRQEALLCGVMFPAAFWIGQSWVEVAILISALVCVLVTELLNSAVEVVVDRVGPEWHELSGRAKDIGSAAVMLSLLLVAGVWGAAIWHRFGS
jgi:diacylglycerol kinase (ATP)